MPLTELMLRNVTDRIFHPILNLDDNQTYEVEAIKQSFKQAFYRAFEQFEERHSQWAILLLDSDFFAKDGIPILVQFLLQDGYPTTSELAKLWLQKANLARSEWRISSVREIEPIAADFLDYLIQSIEATNVKHKLHNAQVLKKAAGEILTIRQHLHTNRSTPGTRRDYLDWLTNYTMYVDAQESTYEERQTLHIKLASVYVVLDTQPSPDLNQGKREPASYSDNLLEAEETLEVGDVVNQFPYLVLLGNPGSGKTTLLNYLAHQHALALLPHSNETQQLPGSPRFPILLRIAEYARHGLSQNLTLSDFLVQACTLHGCPVAGLDDLLTTALTQENCLILLDGLDEVFDAQRHSQMVEQIHHFVDRYGHQRHRFLITSRPTGYSLYPLSIPFVHYRLCEMNEVQIQQFLESWYVAVETAQAPELSDSLRKARARREVKDILQAIETSPGVQHLARNPLILRIIALIHRVTNRLPRRRAELYSQAATIMAQNWRRYSGPEESSSPFLEDAYFDSKLSYLAFWIHTHKPGWFITEEEVYQVLRDEWVHIEEIPAGEDDSAFAQEVSAFLRRVRNRAGLLVEWAPGQYSFFHLSFQEYYAGRYLVKNSNMRAQRIYEHRHKPLWEEPILLGLGFVGLTSPEDASALLETAILAQGREAREQKFAPSPDEDILGRDFLFALRCLGEQIPLRSTLERQLIHRLAQELLYQRNDAGSSPWYYQELWKRVEYLRGCWSARILSSLFIKELNNPDSEVRSRVIEGLGILMEVSDEVVVMLRKKVKDSNPKVRYLAAETLRKMNYISEEVVDIFLQTLRLGESVEPAIRRLAVKSLGQLRRASNDVSRALISALQDKETEVRNQAQKSLMLLGQTHTIPTSEESRLEKFFELWDHLETSEFLQLVESFINEFSRACKLPSVGTTFSVGDWVLAAINIQSLFSNLILPSPILALVFRQQKTLAKQDLNQMRELISANIASNCRLALLILFGNDDRLQKVQEMTAAALRGIYPLDVAVPTHNAILQLLTARDADKDLRSLLLRHINLPSISPFTINGPTQSTFFGRHSELSEIRDGVSHLSYLLIGSRKVGKTSLLYQLNDVWLKEQFRPHLISCQRLVMDKGILTKDDFLAGVTKAWLSDSIEKQTSFVDLVRQLKLRYDQSLVFLVDEVDRLVTSEQQTGWPLIGEMRALAERNECQFIFAGEDKLASATRDADSPFFNFGEKIRVGLLDQGPVFELVRRTMKQQLEIDLVEEDTILERIYTFTSGHPNIVQRLCQKLLGILSGRQLRQITPGDVETIIQDPSFQFEDFLEIFWSHATVLEQAISLIMAKDSRSYYNLSSIRKKLAVHWDIEIKLTQIKPALRRLEELRNILKETQKGYILYVNSFPEVIARIGTVEESLLELKEQFQDHGDIDISRIEAQTQARSLSYE